VRRGGLEWSESGEGSGDAESPSGGGVASRRCRAAIPANVRVCEPIRPETAITPEPKASPLAANTAAAAKRNAVAPRAQRTAVDARRDGASVDSIERSAHW